MKIWNLNHSSAPGPSSRPHAGAAGEASERRPATEHGPPELADELMRRAREMILGAGVPAWAVERIHLFQSPKDYRILACVSAYAQMNQGTADLTMPEIAIHCDLPEVYIEARTQALIDDGCLVCIDRIRDRYLLQVPEQPPTRWGTGPPGSVA